MHLLKHLRAKKCFLMLSAAGYWAVDSLFFVKTNESTAQEH